MAMHRGRSAAAVVAATVGLLGAAGAAVAAGGSARSAGPDRIYGSDNPFAAASASVQVIHTGDDSTLVTLHIRGAAAAAGRTFGAHVHQFPCGASGSDAGGHYQHAGAQGSLEDREVWLDVTVNPEGIGHAEARRAWPLDESTPRSVIVHALATAADGTAGARLACIDLDGAG